MRRDREEGEVKMKQSNADAIKTVGGLVALAVGIGAIIVIALAALFLISYTNAKTDIIASIASSAFGVISAVVGAFFGIKIGTDQTKTLVEANQASQAKAETYALNVPSGEAPRVHSEAGKAADRAITALR
jgi:hypothetical protein